MLERLEKLLASFPHEPNQEQKQVFDKLHAFLCSGKSESVFLLKGFAGTGKTTIVSALIKAIGHYKMKYVMLAPTGRAAKVMSSYSGRRSSTIHRRIYNHEVDEKAGRFKFSLAENTAKNTLFIIDEASMIGNQTEYGGSNLLKDLFDYVFIHDNNKILFIGDEAQLPPVHLEISPALDKDHLEHSYRRNVTYFQLTDVMRQQKESGILKNATFIRECIYQPKKTPAFETKGFKDVYRMTGEKLGEGLQYAYGKYAITQTVIVCRSNKNANLYNQYIRNSIFYYENELEAGDIIMIVKNNYFWMKDNSDIGFIANGEFAELKKVGGEEEYFGLRFCDVEMRLLDYPDVEPFQVKVMLDSLHTEQAALDNETWSTFMNEMNQEYAKIEDQRERFKAMHEDPYINALQIKFAYAVTCHKSQGGQWSAVFLDQGYLTPERIDKEYYRWLYTGMTRAVEELFLVNFDPKLFQIL